MARPIRTRNFVFASGNPETRMELFELATGPGELTFISAYNLCPNAQVLKLFDAPRAGLVGASGYAVPFQQHVIPGNASGAGTNPIAASIFPQGGAIPFNAGLVVGLSANLTATAMSGATSSVAQVTANIGFTGGT